LSLGLGSGGLKPERGQTCRLQSRVSRLSHFLRHCKTEDTTRQMQDVTRQGSKTINPFSLSQPPTPPNRCRCVVYVVCCVILSCPVLCCLGFRARRSLGTIVSLRRTGREGLCSRRTTVRDEQQGNTQSRQHNTQLASLFVRSNASILLFVINYDLE
jgi:hypothetical protein